MKQELNQIAVWLDHSKAQFIAYSDEGTYLLETVESPYERRPRIDGEGSDVTRFGANTYFSNNEDRKHNRLRNELNSYFKELEDRLAKYDDILLFGPTNAKDQLYNRLSANKAFSGKNILIESVGNLTENQTMAFARIFFNATSK